MKAESRQIPQKLAATLKFVCSFRCHSTPPYKSLNLLTPQNICRFELDKLMHSIMKCGEHNLKTCFRK